MNAIWRTCLLLPLAASTASGPARLYAVTVETGMPHLEENLRYAVTRNERCLTRKDLEVSVPGSPTFVARRLQAARAKL